MREEHKNGKALAEPHIVSEQKSPALDRGFAILLAGMDARVEEAAFSMRQQPSYRFRLMGQGMTSEVLV
jgi:hypothetical protein